MADERASALISVRDSITGNETDIVTDVSGSSVAPPARTESISPEPASSSQRGTSVSVDATSRNKSRDAKKSNAAATAFALPGFVPKFLTDALAPVLGGNPRNPHGHPIEGASSSEMRGYLWKQGSTLGAWQRRYFLLHGDVITYYESEETARSGDDGACRFAGEVAAVTRWPSSYDKKPAQINDAVWNAHAKMGFTFSTEDK